MSHLRVWQHNGVVYFAGQVPIESVPVLGLHEGTFGRSTAPSHMATLAQALGNVPPVPLRYNPFDDAKDQ